MASIAYHTPSSVDIAAAVAYADRAGTNAAAERWGVNERTIRKWRVRIDRRNQEATSAPVCPMAQPTSPTLPNTATADDATPASSTEAQSISFGGMAPHQIARDGTLWKCPHCLDLMPVIGGTSSIAWNDEGCYLCASKRLRPTAHGPVEIATSSGPAHGPIPLQSLEPDGPPTRPALEAPLAQPEARHNAPAAQAVQVGLHAAVKPVRLDWLAWWLADERLGLRHTAMAAVMALALMLMCQL